MNFESSNINLNFQLHEQIISILVKDNHLYISDPVITAEIIQRNSFFDYVYFSNDYCYKYNNDYHYYEKMDATVFFHNIYLALKEANLDPRLYDNKDFFLSVCNHFKRNRQVTEPFYTLDFLSLENGVLDLQTHQLYRHTHTRRVGAYATYRYDPKATCPKFTLFLNWFCSENKEMILYFKAWLYAAFFKRPYCPCLILQGPKGTPEVFAHIVQALMGFSQWKEHLLIINDRKDMVQFSFESKQSFPIIIISNKNGPFIKEKLESNNYQVMCFQTKNILKDKRVLSYFTLDANKQLCLEPLELSGILNSILNMQETEAIEILTNNGPSFSNKEDNDNTLTLNLLQWVKEEICPGKGVYLGFHNKDNINNLKVELFPAFNKWCFTHNKNIEKIDNKFFTKELLSCLKAQGFDVQKIRKKNGIFFTNISIKPLPSSSSSSYLPEVPASLPEAPVSSLPTASSSSLPAAPSSVTPASSSVNMLLCHYQTLWDENIKTDIYWNLTKPFDGIDTEIYHKYTSIISNYRIIYHYNSIFKKIFVEDPQMVDQLTEKYLKEVSIFSSAFKEAVQNKIKQTMSFVKKNGLLSMKYTLEGISPQIVALEKMKNNDSLYRIVRNHAYKSMLPILSCRNPDYKASVNEICIKNDHAGLIYALSGQHIKFIEQILNSEKDIWWHLSQEVNSEDSSFYINNIEILKVCFQSNYLLDTFEETMEKVLEQLRLDLGMPNEEFVESYFYMALCRYAEKVVEFLCNTNLFKTYRNLSHQIIHNLIDKNITVPTGHQYYFAAESYKECFIYLLQSYDFVIMAQSTLELQIAYDCQFTVFEHLNNSLILGVVEDVVEIEKEHAAFFYEYGIKFIDIRKKLKAIDDARFYDYPDIDYKVIC